MTTIAEIATWLIVAELIIFPVILLIQQICFQIAGWRLAGQVYERDKRNYFKLWNHQEKCKRLKAEGRAPIKPLPPEICLYVPGFYVPDIDKLKKKWLLSKQSKDGSNTYPSPR